MSDEEARAALRRAHQSEHISLTNQPAATALANLAEVPGTAVPQGTVVVAAAQVQAILALAQEVRDLRLAMYPEKENDDA